MRVLIAYDGSESSEVIFDDLKLAGLPRASEIMVVTAADLLVSSLPVREVAAHALTSPRVEAALRQAEIRREQTLAEAGKMAEKACDRLSLQFPEWNVKSRVLTGDTALEIINAANGWNADLIIVGSQKRSAFNRLLLGSVSKSVVNDSRRSVRVARPVERKKENAPPRIIIGVDGSPSAEEAVFAVGRRVWEDGTQVRLVAVHDQPSTAKIASILPQAAGMIGDYQQTQAQRADEMIQWAMSELRAVGINVSMSIQKGDPKRILLREARQWKADSIFVGTRDFKNSFERFRLGSVSSAIVTNAQCSVEISRPISNDFD